MHDEMLFANEGPEPLPEGGGFVPWKVAVVDDDDSVRAITRLALGMLKVDGRPLELLEAASAAEGIALFAAHADIALGLVDMVMEEPAAGLKVIDTVRNELGNHKVRLVVRTGQPGHLPEERIVRDHEVNDYREKTELSAQKLRSVTTNAIRAYRDLDRLEADYHALIALLAEPVEQDGRSGPAAGVAVLSQALAGLAGWPQTHIALLQHAARLHDLERRLDAQARQRLREHAHEGARMLSVLTLANAIDARLLPTGGCTPDDAAALRAHLEAEAGHAYDPALAALALAHLPQLLDAHRAATLGPPAVP